MVHTLSKAFDHYFCCLIVLYTIFAHRKMNEMQKIEVKIKNDRNVYFRGTARIKFQNLRFIHIHDRKRDDAKLKNDLKKKYETQGCLRLEPRNHIPAIIDQATLDEAIKLSKVNQNVLLDNPKTLPPELKFPSDFRIECLQGRLRVETGMEFLSGNDWWWTVDLYLKSL
jgi:hypothetical protein